nr:MAG: putative capsid protein [Picobirnavirus sp.]
MKTKDEKTSAFKDEVGKGKKKPFQKRATGKKRDYPNDRVRNTDKRVCAGSKNNDPNWYALNPQLLRDAASFPYAWPLGNKLNVGSHGPLINRGSLPGILVMNWVPTVGYSNDGTSPVNVASINTYTKVRHDNSGHANYDHADYMMYLLAMDSVYAFHSWMRRVYGCMLTYSNTNRYYPRAIVKAMGVDFDSLQGTLADFRQYINTYAIKASALAVPAKMSFMTKHYWMSEGLYYDSQQDKPQTYLFNPLGFYKFTLTGGEVARGTLQFAAMFKDEHGAAMPGCRAQTAWSLSDIIKYGDALLAPIISDEDFGIMSGDTLKSFGIGGCYTLPITEETYTVLPSYSAEVLDQIQNATFIGMPDVSSLTIDQNVEIGAGWILADPKFNHPWTAAPVGAELPGQNAFLVNRFVTFEHGDIKPEQTMEATRWTNISVEVTDFNTRSYRVPTMGSEVMCVGNICYFLQNSDGNMEPIFTDDIYVSMNADALYGGAQTTKLDFTTEAKADSSFKTLLKYLNSVLADQYLLIQQLSVFDRHPAVYLSSFLGVSQFAQIYQQSASSPSEIAIGAVDYNTINGVLFDVNYYTVLSSTDLEEMSHIALLSEFDVTVR